jgi:hypothetical protein
LTSLLEQMKHGEIAQLYGISVSATGSGLFGRDEIVDSWVSIELSASRSAAQWRSSTSHPVLSTPVLASSVGTESRLITPRPVVTANNPAEIPNGCNRGHGGRLAWLTQEAIVEWQLVFVLVKAISQFFRASYT